MKKPIRIVLVVLLATVMIALLLFYTLPKRFAPENAARLMVFMGATGEKIEITDSEAINEITQAVTSAGFRRGRRANIDGFRYTLTWYDESGNSLLSLSLLGDSEKLIYQGRFYHVTNGAIDHTPIAELFDEKYID